jgi:hypothetical protein
MAPPTKLSAEEARPGTRVEHFPAFAKRNAREIPTENPEDPLLNVWAIWKWFGINPWLFYHKQRQGWRSLNGKRLKPAKRLPKGGKGQGSGRKEAYYRASEVKAAIDGDGTFDEPLEYPIKVIWHGKKWTWTDAETCEDENGKVYRTAKAAAAKRRDSENEPDTVYYDPPIPPGEIKRALAKKPKKSRFLDGKVLKRTKVLRPAASGWRPVFVFPHSKLKLISKRQVAPDKAELKGLGPIFRNDEGLEILTEEQMAKYMNATRNRVKYWANKDSKVLPGQKALRSEPIPNLVARNGNVPLKGTHPTVRGYFKADADDILAGKELAHPRSSQARHVRMSAEKHVEKAAEVLGKILREAGGAARPADVRAKAREQDISARWIPKALESLKVERVDTGGWQSPCYWWCLPGKKPPAGEESQQANRAGGNGPAISQRSAARDTAAEGAGEGTPGGPLPQTPYPVQDEKLRDLVQRILDLLEARLPEPRPGHPTDGQTAVPGAATKDSEHHIPHNVCFVVTNKLLPKVVTTPKTFDKLLTKYGVHARRPVSRKDGRPILNRRELHVGDWIGMLTDLMKKVADAVELTPEQVKAILMDVRKTADEERERKREQRGE